MKIGDRVELIEHDENLMCCSPIIGDIGSVTNFTKCNKTIQIKFDKYPEYGSYIIHKSSLKLIENLNETEMQTLTRKQLITLHSEFTCTEWQTAIEELLKENVFQEKIDVSSKLELLKSRGSEKQKEAVKKLKITFPKSYLELHNECGLKVGDKVRVTRKATSEENGWDNGWTSEMDDFIGKVFEIKADHKTSGFWLESNYTEKNFPYFVLEKVEEKYVPYTFEDAEKLIGKVIINKDKTVIATLSNLNKNSAFITGEGTISYENLLEYWTELDGSPLGKLIEIN